MERFRFRRLEAHRRGGVGDAMELSLPLPKTASGKIYRCCPDDACTPRLFLLGEAPQGQSIPASKEALIRRPPATHGITCCYCGTDAPDEDFHWSADVEALTGYVEWAAQEDVGEFLEELADNFNRNVGAGGLIRMSIDVERDRRPKPFVWREDLLRDLTCDTCGRAYGVYAVALFCPDCGARNVHVHFAREAELVRRQGELAERVADEGESELGYRLLGNAHEDVLTAFETYLRTVSLVVRNSPLSCRVKFPPWVGRGERRPIWRREGRQ